MKSTNDGMYFFNAGRDLRLPDRVNDATMTARSQHDQSLSSHHESCSDLVLEVVWNKIPGVLYRINFLREASESVRNTYFLASNPQRCFKATERNFPRREGMICNNCRAVTRH